jgi:hypothetical protein
MLGIPFCFKVKGQGVFQQVLPFDRISMSDLKPIEIAGYYRVGKNS